MSNTTKTRDEWNEHLERWKGSGLNQSEYCRQNGLKPYKFTYWKKKLQSPEPDENKFVKLPLTPPPVKSNGDSILQVSIGPDPCLKISINFEFERSWRIR